MRWSSDLLDAAPLIALVAVAWLIIAGLVLGLIYVANVPASPVPETNGCGPWGWGWAFPELGFTEACGWHDLCYQAGSVKLYCDRLFYDEMVLTCLDVPKLVQPVCKTAAWVFYIGVRLANQ
jgi:hypothetical protein